MGRRLLKTILENTDAFELDDEVYMDEADELCLDTLVEVYPFESGRPARWQGKRAILGIEQIRNAISAIEGELGRPATIAERFTAMKYFYEHDAFIDAEDL